MSIEEAKRVTGGTDNAFPGHTNLGGFDNFVARLTPDGEIEWISQFGTTMLDAAWKVEVVGRRIFVAGHTLGTFSGESPSGDFDGVLGPGSTRPTSVGPLVRDRGLRQHVWSRRRP